MFEAANMRQFKDDANVFFNEERVYPHNGSFVDTIGIARKFEGCRVADD